MGGVRLGTAQYDPRETGALQRRQTRLVLPTSDAKQLIRPSETTITPLSKRALRNGATILRMRSIIPPVGRLNRNTRHYPATIFAAHDCGEISSRWITMTRKVADFVEQASRERSFAGFAFVSTSWRCSTPATGARSVASFDGQSARGDPPATTRGTNLALSRTTVPFSAVR